MWMGSANGYVLEKYLPKVQRAHDSFTVMAAQRKLRLDLRRSFLRALQSSLHAAIITNIYQTQPN